MMYSILFWNNQMLTFIISIKINIKLKKKPYFKDILKKEILYLYQNTDNIVTDYE